jgi:hypothetical protein
LPDVEILKELKGNFKIQQIQKIEGDSFNYSLQELEYPESSRSFL